MNKKTKVYTQNPVTPKNEAVFRPLSGSIRGKKMLKFACLLTTNNTLPFFRKNREIKVPPIFFNLFPTMVFQREKPLPLVAALFFIGDSYLVLLGFIFNILILVIASVYGRLTRRAGTCRLYGGKR